MLAKRIIPCLDIKDGRVVKGVNFINLRDAGDPVEQARLYDEQGADELVFLDISATNEGRKTTLDLVARVAERVFMPLTVGGGIRTVEEMHTLLLSGADKVSVNSAAVKRPAARLVSRPGANPNRELTHDRRAACARGQLLEPQQAAAGGVGAAGR